MNYVRVINLIEKRRAQIEQEIAWLEKEQAQLTFELNCYLYTYEGDVNAFHPSKSSMPASPLLQENPEEAAASASPC